MLNALDFYNEEIRRGYTPENPDYRKLHYKLADWIISTCNPLRYFEIGAGMGTVLERMIERDIISFAYDPSPYHVEHWHRRNPEYQMVYTTDINEAEIFLERSCTICAIECFEHMTEDQIHYYLSKTTKASYFIFSSTHIKAEDDEEWGHINVKTQTEWDKLFAQYGWKVSDKKPPITEWAKMYVR